MQRNELDAPISEHTVTSSRAAIVAVAPLVLLAGFVYHPHIAFLPSAEAAAHAVQSDPLRWGIAHLMVAIGATLMSLAYIAIRGYMRDAGENRWSPRALPFLVVGATLYAFLPGTEFSVLAAAKTGADVVAAQKAIDGWFVPTIMTSALMNAIGLFFLARGVSRGVLLGGTAKRIVLVALGVMAVSRFVPFGAVQFYVQGIAGLVAFWPIAYEINHFAVSPLRNGRTVGARIGAAPTS